MVFAVLWFDPVVFILTPFVYIFDDAFTYNLQYQIDRDILRSTQAKMWLSLLSLC